MKWLLTISAIISLFSGMAAGFFASVQFLYVGCIGCAGFLIAANLDRLAEVKASWGGIEAKTREINAALGELRFLALKVGELALSLIKRHGRMGGYTDEEENTFKESVLDLLKKVGATEGEIEKAQRDWHRVTEFDYAWLILGSNVLPDDVQQNVAEEWHALAGC